MTVAPNLPTGMPSWSITTAPVPSTDGTGRIAAALAKARGEFGSIKRSREVMVRTDKGAYKFAYAPLDEILAAVVPALTKHGLALTQDASYEGEHAVLVSHLLHESGERIESRVPLVMPQGERAGPQAVGSAITYARRYGIANLLCVAADEDDDGNAAEGNLMTRNDGRYSKAELDETRAKIDAKIAGIGTPVSGASSTAPVNPSPVAAAPAPEQTEAATLDAAVARQRLVGDRATDGRTRGLAYNRAWFGLLKRAVGLGLYDATILQKTSSFEREALRRELLQDSDLTMTPEKWVKLLDALQAQITAHLPPERA